FNPQFDITRQKMWKYINEHKNVIVTPHIAGSTEDAWRLTERKAIDMNIYKLNGRPLIDYQVLAARAATSIDRIICSTDDEKIAGHCRGLGINVHERPAELASDSANVVDAIKHFLL
ncbi:Acylneuraminate cytidylyltransferase like protein, partial [Aduncisulcus paluster]